MAKDDGVVEFPSGAPRKPGWGRHHHDRVQRGFLKGLARLWFNNVEIMAGQEGNPLFLAMFRGMGDAARLEYVVDAIIAERAVVGVRSYRGMVECCIDGPDPIIGAANQVLEDMGKLTRASH